MKVSLIYYVGYIWLLASCAPCKTKLTTKEKAYIAEYKKYPDSTLTLELGSTNFKNNITDVTSCATIVLKSSTFYYELDSSQQIKRYLGTMHAVEKITYNYNYNLGERGYDISLPIDLIIDTLPVPVVAYNEKLEMIKLIGLQSHDHYLDALKSVAKHHNIKIKFIDIIRDNGVVYWVLTPRSIFDPILQIPIDDLNNIIILPRLSGYE